MARKYPKKTIRGYRVGSPGAILIHSCSADVDPEMLEKFGVDKIPSVKPMSAETIKKSFDQTGKLPGF
jgi:hypothetical protein